MGQQMDEGVKISKSNKWQILDEVLYKTHKTHEIPLHLGTKNKSIAWKTPVKPIKSA